MLTGSSGGSGTSSSASSLAASPSAIASSRSSSVASKPTRSRSKRSSRSHASSSASSSSLPARLQGELVVRDQVRPLLRLAQVLEPDHRHLGEPELARREQPAVAGEDAGVLVDQDRVGPAELDHRRRDLIDLRLAVRARVALVRAQAVDRPQLDPVGERDQPGGLRRSRHRPLQSRHSHRTIATMAAPIAITVSARSTIAGACSASCGTSSASSAARPAAELGWLSRSSSRRQRRDSWSRLMRCLHRPPQFRSSQGRLRAPVRDEVVAHGRSQLCTRRLHSAHSGSARQAASLPGAAGTVAPELRRPGAAVELRAAPPRTRFAPGDDPETSCGTALNTKPSRPRWRYNHKLTNNDNL